MKRHSSEADGRELSDVARRRDAAAGDHVGGQRRQAIDQPEGGVETMSALNPNETHVLSPDGHWLWRGGEWVPAGPPLPMWARAVNVPVQRALWARGILIVLAASYGVCALTQIAATASEPAWLLDVQAVAAIVATLTFVAGAIAIPMWCHRAYRNLPALGAGVLRFSPGWAAGSWFGPALNLFRPYQVLRELWVQSRTSPEPWTLLKRGWALYLLGSLLSKCTLTTSDGAFDLVFNAWVNAIGLVLGAAGALAAGAVVRRITDWQLGRAGSG